MGKGRHGTNMIGNSHSHDDNYPDDTWNLYNHIDKTITKALNILGEITDIFKPSIKKLEEYPNIKSDLDSEILINIYFLAPVFIKEICIIGGGENKHHPKKARFFPNKILSDFNELESIRSDLNLDLPINKEGLVVFPTNLSFQRITSLSIFFNKNHSQSQERSTIIKYIGFKGEHTHEKRQAINTNYELIGNVKNIDCSLSNNLLNIS